MSSHRGRVGVHRLIPGTALAFSVAFLVLFPSSVANARAEPRVLLTAHGAAWAERLGYAVSDAGDFNGDGYADVIAGAYLNDAGGRNAGRAYLYYGGPSADSMADLVLTGTEPDAEFGWSVSGAGDFNGDGHADVIVGAPYRDGSPAAHVEKAYLFFGGPSPDSLPDLVLVAEGPSTMFGTSVAGAGDVNGDGYADVIVGAPSIDRAYVYHGGPTADATPDWVLPSPTTRPGPPFYDGFSWSVGTGGDLNGDGYDDVVVGAPWLENIFYLEPEATGRAYVFQGGVSPDGIPDLTMTGESPLDRFGYSARSTGDLNGDGRPDLIVGAPGYDGSYADRGDRGRAYVFLGGDGMNAIADLCLTGAAAGDAFGASVSGAGDLNADGLADLIVGADLNDEGGSGAGKAYVYLGPDSVADLELTGEAAFDHLGISVSRAGDFDGDGRPDVVVGAWGSDAGVRTGGAAYVVSAAPSLLPSAVRLVMDAASATGPVVRGPDLRPEPFTVMITDSLDAGTFSLPPRDTVPAHSRIDFRWHAEPTVPGTYVVAYRYKLDEPEFVSVDSSAHAVSYNTGIGGDVVTPGPKLFVVRLVDNRGRVREINRRFQMNYAPVTWFSGLDSTRYPPDPASGERYVNVPDWNDPPAFPGSLLSCDSILTRPAERPQHRTFFEIYGNRVYVRSEHDTVHLNSWIVLHNGGSDLDSPFDVKVDPSDPGLPDTTRCTGAPKMLRPAGLTGSPIGFRQRVAMFLTPAGPLTMPAESGLYPLFDPGSVLRAPVIGGWSGLTRSGTAYAVVRAVDGNGAADARIDHPKKIVDDVDAGLGTPEEQALRARILVFHVDKPQFLRIDDPAFVPRPNQVFSGRVLRLNLLADDVDPLDPFAATPVGGPSPTKLLRWNVTLHGRNAEGRDSSFTLPAPQFSPVIDVALPEWLAGTNVTVEVELCDCADCDLPGAGRCIKHSIPIRVPPPVRGGRSS